jgi:hypothetical protein
MEVDGEMVLNIKLLNGRFVSPSDKKVQLEAYELKTALTSREGFYVGQSGGVPKYLFKGLGPRYTQDLMENLPFLYLQKEPSASTADLYLLPRAAGWIRSRSITTYRTQFSGLVQAWASGKNALSKTAFEDCLHFGHIVGITYKA